MSLRHLMLLGSVLLLLAVGWNVRDAAWLQALLRPTAAPQAPIQFDNGTVRQPKVAVRDPAAPKPLGVMRKCHKTGQVIYTANVCPPGFQEMEVKGGKVNVVDPVRVPARAPEHEPSIADQRMERIINR